MTLIYIHGASATRETFTHIRQQLGGTDLCLDYDSANGFKNNLAAMKQQLDSIDSMFFIAHSLGGIYALHLATHYMIRTHGAVTMSTPYGGCKQADYARYFLPFSKLMRDIGPLSAPIAQAKSMALPCAWTQIVTTQGQSPWMHEPNDGVVTVRSQRFRSDMDLIESTLNHYEVVISNSTSDLIESKLLGTHQ